VQLGGQHVGQAVESERGLMGHDPGLLGPEPGHDQLFVLAGREVHEPVDAPSHHAPKRRAPKCQLLGPKGESIPLPETVFYVLERVAEVMARGDSIAVVPVGREVTTQQAAELLNVSRQYLVRLLEEKRIPFRRTGKHRRLRVEDVLSFKEQRDKDRCAGLRDLSQMTQEFGGYDSELK
jgi:excisionase family DNA binding protein